MSPNPAKSLQRGWFPWPPDYGRDQPRRQAAVLRRETQKVSIASMAMASPGTDPTVAIWGVLVLSGGDKGLITR
jgi:hypothetical protein